MIIILILKYTQLIQKLQNFSARVIVAPREWKNLYDPIVVTQFAKLIIFSNIVFHFRSQKNTTVLAIVPNKSNKRNQWNGSCNPRNDSKLLG